MAEDPLGGRTPSRSDGDADAPSKDSNAGTQATDPVVDDVTPASPADESTDSDADETRSDEEMPEFGDESMVASDQSMESGNESSEASDERPTAMDSVSSLDELAATIRERSAANVDPDSSLSSLVSDLGLADDSNDADPGDPTTAASSDEQDAGPATTDDEPERDGDRDETSDPASPADATDVDGTASGNGDDESEGGVTSADIQAHLNELATGISGTAGGEGSAVGNEGDDNAVDSDGGEPEAGAGDADSASGAAGTDDETESVGSSDGTDESPDSTGTRVGPIEHAELGEKPPADETASSADRLRALADHLRPGGGDAGANPSDAGTSNSGLDADTSAADMFSADSGGSDVGFPPTAGGSGPSADAAGSRLFDDSGSGFGGMSTAPWQQNPTDPEAVLAALDGEDATETTDEADVSGARHVLLAGGLDCPACNARCIELLTQRAPTEVNALFVTVSGDIDERLEDWQAHAGGYPANASLVTVGGSQPSGSSTVIETRSGPDRITVDSVSDPADLTRLGVALTRRLEEWSSNPYPTVLCLDSLTELLQYVELRRLFRFVHVLQNTLARVDGQAHYHLDRDAHEPRTVKLFQTLVDATVTVEIDN